MCGICGYVHLDNSKRPSEIILKSMMRSLAHRGPDDEGVYINKNAALGHRRLSIIDLTTGHQPIFNEDGSVAIVYNGEIYNFPEMKIDLASRGHVFKTNSDTEVIVHAYEEYGRECPKYLNGMFAFAIWDSRKDSLLLARDRFGKKPLYYASFDNQFMFASELKAILKHPSAERQIDMGALAKYLAHDYVPAPQSIFKGISKLEAGSTLVLKDGTVRKERYWDINVTCQDGLDPEDAKTRLITLLRDSVKRRLISDVPLGVFLSGGIDSSAVVAMMAEVMEPKRIKTFSISFKEKEYDESGDARRVAEHFGTDHHEEMLGPKAMLDVFPEIAELLDEPFADSSIIPTYLVSKFTRKTVKVALGGDGGDELFLGYPSFRAHAIAGRLNMVPAGLRDGLLKMLAKSTPYSQAHMNIFSYMKRFARGYNFPEEVRQQVWTGSFTPDAIKRLFLSKISADYDIFDVYSTTRELFNRAKGMDPLNRAMYIYMKTYMADDILAKVDRASMANSLEVRAPFLDKNFAEFAVSIPPKFKLRGITAKWILKKALEGRLPPETLTKSKRGFAVPVAAWLKNELRACLNDVLDKRRIAAEGIFDPAYIDGIVRDFMDNRRDVRREIWSLFMFEIWYSKWAK